MIVGALDIQLRADIARLQRDMDAGRRVVNDASASMSRAVDRVKMAFVAMTAAFAALGAAKFFTSILNEQEQFQRNLLRTEALLKSNGHAANLSSQQLRKNAQELALATLQSVEGVERAQQILLTFTNVTGDTFLRATEAAANLATVTGGDLNGSMTMLGKALNDPVAGITAMTRAGVSFSEQQKETIKKLADSNKLYDAQKMILDELARQYGGVAKAEASGFAGAMDTLSQRTQEAKIALADYLQIGSRGADIVNWWAQQVNIFATAVASGAAPIAALGNALSVSAKIAAGYFAIFVAAPMIYTAAAAAMTRLVGVISVYAMNVAIGQTATFGFNTALFGTSVAAQLAAGSLSKIALAGNVLFAAFAGWQIGTYLSDNFVEARIAGMVFVAMMLKGWESIKFGAAMAWEGIGFAWDKTVNSMKLAFAEYLSVVASGLSSVGATDTSKQVSAYADSLRTAANAQESFAERTAGIESAHRKVINAIDDDIVAQMQYELAAKKVVAVDAEVIKAKAAVVGLTEEQRKAAEKLAADQKTFIKGIEKEVSELGLSAAAIKLNEAATLGLTGKRLDHVKAMLGTIESYKLEAAWVKKSAEANADNLDLLSKTTVQLRADVLAQQDQNDRIGLGTVALAELDAQRLEYLATIKDENAELAELIDWTGAMSQAYRDQAKALRDRAGATREGASKGENNDVTRAKELLDIMVQVDEATKSAAQGMAESFGKVGSAIGSLTTALSGYGRAQATIAAQLKAVQADSSKSPAEKAAAEIAASKASAQAQVKSYGDMASAAKGFFKENSTGYKVMEGAEKAFRAAEMAMAIQNMLSKSGLLTAFTGLFVASKATEKTVEAGATATSAVMASTQASAWGVTAVVKAIASMPFPANLAAGAATLAAVVAIGAKIAGGFGGGGSGGGQSAADAQKSQGTGGVFGDTKAVSDSILRSLELLEKNSDSLIPINRGMLSALNAIKNSMVGLTNLLVREPGVTDGSNFGIQTGQLDIGKATDGISKQMTIITKTLFAGFGDKIASFVNNLWGKTTQSIVDSGLQFSGTLRGLQAGQGFNQYASVDTTRSSMFGLSKKTTNSLQTQGLSGELTAQFGQIFTNVEKALSAAAAGLGIGSASVTAALDALVIDVTKVSLKGLTGTALTEALNAVLSKTMDEMAQAAIPGMDAFRQVGEGYAETVIRLASNYAQLDATLQSIGMTFGATGVSSLTARESLIAMAGGIDKFTEQASGFADNFLTEAERLAPVQRYVTEELGRMGLAGITTRDQFKDIVLGLNVSTAAGAETYTALMALQEAFALVVPAIEATGSAAKTAAQVLDERRNLQNQLDELIMTSAQLRDKERMSLDETNRALFDRIIAEREAKDAIDNAAATSKAAADSLSSVNKSWQDQIDAFIKAQMSAAEVRALELAGMEPSTKALYLRLEALKAEKDAVTAVTAGILADMNLRAAGTVASQAKATAEIVDLSKQRASMELALYNLTHNAAEQLARARQLEIDGMDAALHPLQNQIYAMQDQASAAALAATALENAAASARAIASERGGLQREMFQMTGNTAALRKLELEALDPSNRALKESIFALQDKMAADQAAAAAAEQMAQAMAAAAAESRRAADELKKAWQGATDSIFDEVARIRGLTGSGSGESLASAQARFTVTSAQARAGDQDAAKLLPGMSQALLTLAESNAVTAADLRRIQAQTAASLMRTGSGFGAQFGLSLPSFDVGANFIPSDMIAQLHEGERVIPAADNARLEQRLASPGVDTSALEEKVVSMTKAISRLESALDKIARDSNRVANIQQGIADGDIIVQTESA